MPDDPRPGSSDTSPAEKKGLSFSWSWKCGPEIWLAKKIKKLIDKVKK
jgi:hypothetical protein